MPVQKNVAPSTLPLPLPWKSLTRVSRVSGSCLTSLGSANARLDEPSADGRVGAPAPVP